jgi:hypothetical protein
VPYLYASYCRGAGQHDDVHGNNLRIIQDIFSNCKMTLCSVVVPVVSLEAVVQPVYSMDLAIIQYCTTLLLLKSRFVNSQRRHLFRFAFFQAIGAD